jgi:hypothetical protein
MYDYEKFDEISYIIGMIDGFCEVVRWGCKPLALSPSMTLEQYEIVGRISNKIAEESGVKSYVESDFLVTGLASEEYTRNKIIIFYFLDNQVLDEYLKLKGAVQEMEKCGIYLGLERVEATIKFCGILGYNEDLIKKSFNILEEEKLRI